MEATSDEVEAKKLLEDRIVARYLQRLNEARGNLKIRVQKIEHLVKTQDVYVSKGLSEFTVTWTSFKTQSSKSAIALTHVKLCCKLATLEVGGERK